MSRHDTVTQVGEHAVTVVMGYDRMCGHFFLEVRDPALPEDVEAVGANVYDSSYDERLYTPDRAGSAAYGGLLRGEMEARLEELCVSVPAPMLEAVLAEEFGGGGQLVRHW
ncbi:hypothetical protein [Deinococcus ruber]|nr:hypothetical protein [Deinococcus ruber]